MYCDLGTQQLRSGEAVTLARIDGPDLEWAARVGELLGHKGEPWNWQNTELLIRECGVAACFHILHRDGAPFANVMVVSHHGVGLLGHVYTKPGDRGGGAAGKLVRSAIEHFRASSGVALYLFTEPNSAPSRMYQNSGFQPIEPESSYMAWFRDSEAEFESRHFASGATRIEPLQWRHWPMACPLFAGPYPGTVRCAPYGLCGRRTAEEPLLPLVQDEAFRRERGEEGRAVVLELAFTQAVVGLAVWRMHPVWPDSRLVDVYCHPAYWAAAPDLFQALQLPAANRSIAYADPDCPAKAEFLRQSGFQQVAVLPNWIPADAARSRFAEVWVFEKR